MDQTRRPNVSEMTPTLSEQMLLDGMYPGIVEKWAEEVAGLEKRLEEAERVELAAAREWRGIATTEDKAILNDAGRRQREAELAAFDTLAQEKPE
jgi:hypothetical protein